MTWIILEEILHNKRLQFKVQCDCGIIEIRRKDHVVSGRTKSCKVCSCKETLRKHPNKKFGSRPHEGIGDISKTLIGAYRFAAKRRGIPFEITGGYAWAVFQSQNGMCALSGVPITIKHGYKNSNIDWKQFTASLDRINPDSGYIIGNIQWVHEDVNYIKRDLDEKEFIEWCERIAEYKGGDVCG
jgi:hypothetical protein